VAIGMKQFPSKFLVSISGPVARDVAVAVVSVVDCPRIQKVHLRTYPTQPKSLLPS